MATGGDNVIGSDFDYKTVEINEESLYSSDLIPGIASTAQRIPYLNIPVTAYNPDILQPSGAYWEPAAAVSYTHLTLPTKRIV